MLTAILIWFYTGALCYAYGALFFKKMPFALTVLAGLVVLTVLAQFFSLFLPMGWMVLLILLAGAIGAVLTRRISLPQPATRPVAWLPLSILVLILILVLENATQRSTHPDTSLYHAQAIRWIESYPAVPGLGNLHGRLAFNSAWFVTNALFSFSFLGLGSFHLSAGFLFLLVLFFFWQGFASLVEGQFSASNLLKTAFLPLAFYVLGGELSSPGSDLPASLLIWLAAVLWLEKSEQEQPYHAPLIILLIGFAITVKLSALPLVLFFIPFLWQEKHRFARLLTLGVLVVLPFFLRNLVLSGYLIYPFPALDLFDFDWKVPAVLAENDRRGVIGFGRLIGTEDVFKPFSEWFPYWLSRQTLNRRVIFFAALLTPLASLPLRFAPRMLWTGWLVMYSGVLFWLSSAPDFRFGYGFLLATLLLALIPWLLLVIRYLPFIQKIISPLTCLFLVAYLLFTLARSFELRTFPNRVLLPADYDRVPVETCSLANASAFCAREYGFCGYAELPCAPSPRYWVALRGADLRDGFRALPR